MRVPPSADVPNDAARRSFAPRLWLVGAVFVILVLVLSLRGIAHFYTDYLWFDELRITSTWSGLIGARLIPAALFTLVSFIVLLVNLVVADRIAPKQRVTGPEDELVERYRHHAAPYSGRIRVLVAVLFALALGVGVSSRWQSWLLYRNSVKFGVKDPQFNKDVGFYVFELPFIRFVLEWAFVGLAVALLLTLVFHYLNGGVRVQAPFQRVTPQVKAHVSVLLAVMALTKTGQYWFARYELVFSSRGPVDGASYTDVKAQLPAYNFLILVSITAAVLFLANIRRRGWALPVIAVAVWGFVSVVVGTMLPYYVQRFQVQPNEYSKERRYIQRNIDATREAFGLDDAHVTSESFDYSDSAAPATVEANLDSLRAARTWDPRELLQVLQQRQEIKSFYRFGDVDVDRYRVGDSSRLALVATRDLDSANIPNNTWVNQHLAYTHGYGMVVTDGSDPATGEPNYLLGGIPPEGTDGLELDRPGVYYGQGLSSFAVVNTKSLEVEPGESGEDAKTTYAGSGGVEVSSFLHKAALALRFNDWNLFISGQIESDSRVLYVRDVRERVAKAAPFLSFDSDPYPVVVDGAVQWVVDGYTTTDRYPYAQRVSGEGGLASAFNYARNSVKAVVDAYDGTVTLYVVDDEDPLIQAYRKAFPDMFTDGSEMPSAIRGHLRYPEELFKVQSEQFARYFVTDPQTFFSGSQFWSVAAEPPSAPDADLVSGITLPTPTSTVVGNDGGRNTALAETGTRIDPLYLTMKLPGGTGNEFVLMRPYSPLGKPNILSGFLVARMDGDRYGELVAYELDTSADAPSPNAASTAIQTDTNISGRISLLDQNGSSVIFGEMQTIPVTGPDGGTIVYARPLYVRQAGERSFPQFRGMLVVQGKKAVYADTMELALRQLGLLGDAPDEGEEPEPPGTDLTVADLLDRADKEFEKADAVIEEKGAAGIAEREEHLAAAREYVARALELADRLEGQGATDGSGSGSGSGDGTTSGGGSTVPGTDTSTSTSAPAPTS